MFRRSNGKLYLEYEAYGKTVQKSTRLLDTPKNRTLIKKEVIPVLHAKILTGELSQEKPKDFLHYSKLYLREKEHLKSYPQIESRVHKLNDYFDKVLITQLKKYHIKEWVQDRLQINTPKTLRDYLTDIRGIINVAIDLEHIKDNVADRIKLPSHEKKDIEPFSQEEVIKLLNNSNEWFRLYLAISFYTGMRTGEVMALTRSDIDFEERVIHIRRSVSKNKVTTPKTQKSIRSVPILDDLVPYLKRLPKNRSIFLFSKQDGTITSGSESINREEYNALLKRCDIKYRKIYATRHTFIVSMLKYSNLSILEIAQIVGHTTTQMIVQNYGKYIKGEHLRIDRNLKLFTDNSTDRLA